jgi:hypothetical protein
LVTKQTVHQRLVEKVWHFLKISIAHPESIEVGYHGLYVPPTGETCAFPEIVTLGF